MKRIISICVAGLAVGNATDFNRDLSPDRPDATESPITVEKRGVQVESSLWSFSRNKDVGEKINTWSVGETNLKFGITDQSDLQFVVRPWVSEEIKTFVSRTRAEGFGDLDVRWKQNLWGNDGGPTAFALMPFVTIPTQTAVSIGEWEGGLIAPLSIELSENLGLGLMAEIDRVWDDQSKRHEWDFVHTAVLGIGISDSLGMYLEYIGNTAHGRYEASASMGMTWAQTSNLQWDFGVVLGLNDAAEDIAGFQGLTIRF
jgi:hypothetical protein